MRPILVLSALALTSLQAQQPPVPTVRDSAGVMIVEHRTIKTTQIAFTVSAAPVIDLGGLKDDSNAELDAGDPFPNAVRLSDGRYVASTRTALKMFDAKGAFIRSVGRAGNGPGEFVQMREVCRATGDTLIVLPYSNRQVSVFDSSGKHVRSFVVSGVFLGGACFDDGTLVVRTNYRVNPATTMTPDRASQLDRVADFVRARSDGTPMGLVATGNVEVYTGVSPHPNAYARGRFLYVGDGRAPDVRVYTSEGKLAQLLRWQDPLLKMPADARSGEAALGSTRGAQPPEMGLGVVPPYSRVLADDAGRIWVEDYHLSREPGNWTVFAADGRLLGRVSVPAIRSAEPGRVEIVRVMRDQVVLNWRDTDNGARHLSIHALTPGTR